MNKITELHNYLSDNNVKLSLLHLQVIENIMREYAEEYHKKQLLLHGVIKRLEDLQKYYLDGDGYENSGGWMSKEDDTEKGEWIKLGDLQNIINDLKSNVL